MVPSSCPNVSTSIQTNARHLPLSAPTSPETSIQLRHVRSVTIHPRHQFSSQTKPVRVEELTVICTMAPPTPLTHVLETILYTKDIVAAQDFYTNILNLTPIPGMSSPRGCGYQLGNTHLLIFALGETNEDIVPDLAKPDIKIPLHGPTDDVIDILMDGTKTNTDAKPNRTLRQHYCLAVEAVTDAKEWEKWFVEKDVTILGRMEWERGGYSVYFADPDGHVGEVGSRGIWPNY